MNRLAPLSVALALFTSPALACMPQMMEPSSAPVAREACAVQWVLTEIRSVGLGSIAAAPGGLLFQDIYDGNACYWEANLLVQDCATGQALVIGPDDRELMTEPRETGLDRIALGLEQGVLTSLEAVAALAEAEGYTPLAMAAGATIAVNGQTLDTTCACVNYRVRP